VTSRIVLVLPGDRLLQRCVLHTSDSLCGQVVTHLEECYVARWSPVSQGHWRHHSSITGSSHFACLLMYIFSPVPGLRKYGSPSYAWCDTWKGSFKQIYKWSREAMWLRKKQNKKTLEKKSYSRRYEEDFIHRTQAVLSVQ